MNRHVKWIWVAALLLSPLAASAQTPKTDPGAAPPAVAPAPPADDDDGMWLADLFGTDDAIESAFAAPDQGPMAMGDMAEAPEAPEAPGGNAFGDDGGGPGGPGGSGGPGNWHGAHGRMGRGGGRGMMMRRGMANRLAALDLTDAQRTKLRDIHEAQARKNVQRRADIQLAHMDLQKLMRADTPNSGAVNAQIDKISKLQADGMKARYDARMQARAVLTPEQLKKLRAGPAARAPHSHQNED